jgi:hypothetical protein
VRKIKRGMSNSEYVSSARCGINFPPIYFHALTVVRRKDEPVIYSKRQKEHRKAYGFLLFYYSG